MILSKQGKLLIMFFFFLWTFVSLSMSTFTTTSHYSWKAPRYILNMPDTRHDRVRKKFHILVDGDYIPPPIKSFREMKFPPGFTCADKQICFSAYTHHTKLTMFLFPQQFSRVWKRRELFIPHQSKFRECQQCKFSKWTVVNIIVDYVSSCPV